MRFTWGVRKNRENIQKHSLDFAGAYKVFNFPMVTALDACTDYGEDRWFGLGILDNRVVVVVFTETNDVIRIISLRKALKHERDYYEKNIKNRLEKN